jgi:predicted metal-dependent enzyme (double-stranded beta helix superfamily)
VASKRTFRAEYDCESVVIGTASERVLAHFQRLGRKVDQEWSARGRRSHQLAAIATKALCEMPAPDELTPEVVLSTLAVGKDLPKQRKSSDPFGQPPAVLYQNQNQDLEIQVLTWLDGTTSTHQHGFDGAFQVTAGSSLHVPYSFEQDEVLADGHLVAGKLTMIHTEILRPGDVRPIVSGPEFIHALFHLERPSVTIVVRNAWSHLPFPQYDYRLPGFGWDALDKDDTLSLRLRGLHSLCRLNRESAASLAREIVVTQDLWTAFRVCDEWALSYGEGAELAALVEALSARAGVFESLLAPMYAEEVRRARLLARRGMLRDVRHRMFLAMVVNLPDRTAIHSAMSQMFPGEDASSLIVDLVEELASPQYRGISGLNLGPQDLQAFRSRWQDDHSEEGLGTLAKLWKPPPLLETLFS